MGFIGSFFIVAAVVILFIAAVGAVYFLCIVVGFLVSLKRKADKRSV